MRRSQVLGVLTGCVALASAAGSGRGAPAAAAEGAGPGPIAPAPSHPALRRALAASLLQPAPAGPGMPAAAEKDQPPVVVVDSREEGAKGDPGKGADGSRAEPIVWEFTPYLWAAGVDGSVTARGREVPVEADFIDLLKKLDGAVSFALNGQRGRLGFLSEVYRIRLTDEHGTPGPVFNRVTAELTQLLVETGLAYSVLRHGGSSLDLLAGARFWDFDTQIDFQGGPLGPRHFSNSRSWVDPIVGGRVRAVVTPKLAVLVRGDYGGFGASSEATWQFVGGIGWKTARRQELKAGYRILTVDRVRGDAAADIEMKGPILGYTFRM